MAGVVLLYAHFNYVALSDVEAVRKFVLFLHAWFPADRLMLANDIRTTGLLISSSMPSPFRTSLKTGYRH